MIVVKGRVIDCTGADPLEKGAIVVNEGRIVDIGKESEVRVPKDAEVINASGKTILPGLIDFHNHFVHPRPFEWFFSEAREYGAAKAALLGMHNAENWIKAGITTVCDHGGDMPLVVALRDEIDAGRILGPRTLFACFVSKDAKGPDEIRKSVEEIFSRGVAHRINLGVSGGFTNQTLNELYRTPEEVKSAVEAVHAHGKGIDGFSMNARGCIMLCEAGVDSIGHAVALNDDALEAIKKRNIPWCPVCYSLYQSSKIDDKIPDSDVNMSRLSPPIRKAWMKAMQADMKKTRENVRKAYDMGIRLLASSDIAPPRTAGVIIDQNNLACDMELIMQWSGMNPMEALMTATKYPAMTLGWGDKIGTLEKGKIADITICTRDPLRKLGRALDPSNIWLVMRKGKLVYAKHQ